VGVVALNDMPRPQRLLKLAEGGFRENKSESISAAEADTLTAHSIANLASKGHEGMRAVYEAVGFYPGISIAQTVTTLDLPLYVIGAGVLSAWDLRRLSFEP
jgi:predicted NBD/HSP70 family sugar kinase